VVAPDARRHGPPATREASLAAVVCVDDESRRRVVITALASAGFETVAVVDRGLDAVTAAAGSDADLVVVDLTLVGALGMRLVGVLKAARQGCQVILLTPLETLDGLAREAGANAVIHEDDVRGLRTAARRIRSQHVSHT
jgi:DNA-binding response OmpR family regulator